MPVNTVAVIGLGYIGLPTAAILASKDIKVLGVDVNESTVAAVNRGDVPFVEPDLATYVAGAVTQGQLRATLTPEPADAYIVAVPTPFTAGMKPDLSYIEAAARALAPCLHGGELVILESTVPPRATEQMAAWILQERPDLSLDGTDGRPVIHVAHCPERVLPGRVMVELVTNDRIVGGLTPTAAERARELYQVFCHGEILLTDAVTAEMAKLAENTYRDVNIAFANELASICEEVGVDAWELIRLANHHPRVDILSPGPGVGGHCIAVDPWFMVDAAPKRARLIRRARKVNARRPSEAARQIVQLVRASTLHRIALLGLAFKADVDDLRESPAVEVVLRVAKELGAAVRIDVVEPYAAALPPELRGLDGMHLVPLDLAVAEAELVVRLVSHSEFRGFAAACRASVPILDFRGGSAEAGRA